ncbi:MAG: ferritin-like domain-containing protein [Solirubrobacteraceae bacterium]
MTESAMTEPAMTESERPSEGAVARLVRDDCERKKFLKMAGKPIGAAAAATSLAAFIAACGGSSSSSSSGDLKIVNYALTLEYLESEFYAKVIKSRLFHGQSLSVIKTFGHEEHEHVAALHKLAKSLGTPAAKPKGKFPIKNAGQVTKLASVVENLGAAAYLGQAGHIQSKEILAAALAIHSIEARHAATLNLLLKKSPTPHGAFAKPASMSYVLKAVKPFIA